MEASAFVRIISNDNTEFYLDERVARLSGYFSQQLNQGSRGREGSDFITMRFANIRGEIMEIIVQYLHYKARYLNMPSKEIPPFPLTATVALDVLKASTMLNL